MELELDRYQQMVLSFPANRPLVVRACAGAGKSSTLALRAKALIDSGVPPSSILVLTFSVRSKTDLQAKMQRVFAAGDSPVVLTHHAYALSVIRSLGCSHKVIEAREQKKLMKECMMRGAISLALSLSACLTPVAHHRCSRR